MRRLHLTLLMLAPVAAGCTEAVSGAGATGDAEVATQTSAIVIVQRTVETEGVRAEASARFLRVPASTSTDDALRAIGAASDLPSRGTCGSIWSPTTDAREGDHSPVVELVDVGSVSLETMGAETRLVPRQLPDVTDVVSGVVYARAADPTLLPPAARYVVHVAGKPEFGGFDVSAMAPADASDVHVTGEGDSGGAVVLARDTALDALDVTWTRGSPTDSVYVDVQPAGVRCVLADTARKGESHAHGAVSGSLFDDAGTLTVHRLHRESLRAIGMETGEIRFDFARVVPYTRH